MAHFVRDVKSALTKPYLATSKLLTRSLLRGQTGERDFSRIVIVAALGRNNGIGSGARLQWKALQQAGIEAQLLDAAPALRNPLFRVDHHPGTAYIFHADGPGTASLIRSVLPYASHAYRIGYWAWELPDPPREWARSELSVDEIWTPSTFSRNSLARMFAKRIEVVPHTIPALPMQRRRPDGPFSVLAMADSRSSMSRKNPEGALRAFRAAFGTSTTARLIIKLSGRPEEVRALERSLGELLGGDNVEILRTHLSDTELAAVYDRTDVFLSLHRAEGFGLPMAEAMARGLPVVATGWSGNLDFMSENDSCLVPYRLVPVSDISAVYGESIWAEPDIYAASEALRRLCLDDAHYARTASAAYLRANQSRPWFPFSGTWQRNPTGAQRAHPGAATTAVSPARAKSEVCPGSAFSPT